MMAAPRTYSELIRGLENAVAYLCFKGPMIWKGEIEAVQFALDWMQANEDDLRAFLAVEDPAEATQIWPEIGI